MPEFTFTSPSGESYKMTGPEGSTKEQAFEKFKSMKPDLFKAAPATKKEPMGPQEPAYDPMGVQTGYTQPSVKPTEMPYGEQVGKALEATGEIYKAVPRGLAKGAIGGPGALEEFFAYSVPEFLGAKKTKERPTFFPTPERVGEMMEQVGLGKTPEAYKGFEFAGELVGGLKSYGPRAKELVKRPEVITAEQLTERIRGTGESMADAARKMAEERFGKGTKEAQDAYEAAIKGVQERRAAELGVQAERMTQAEKKARAIVAPEDEAIRAASRKTSNISDPVNVADEVEKLAAAKWEAAQVKKASGGKAYETFADAAKAQEAVKPFETSPQGQALFEELSAVSKGGEGALIEYTKAEQKLATEIIEELFPRKSASFTEKQVAERAAQNPNKSMSPAAKLMQARRELQEAAGKTAEEARPVNYDVVKTKAQELRALQEQRGGATGFKVKVGERYKDPAQRIESALKEWVGEENWPASIYKEASKEANKFETEIGNALTSQEKIPFSDQPGKFTTPRKELPSLIFRSKDDTKYAKELLGESEVNRLGELFASNEIKGLNSEGVVKWLEKNDFYKSIPGLEDKLKRYTNALRTQEGNVAATKILRSQKEAEIELLKKGFGDVVKDIEAEAASAKKSLDKKVSSAGKALEDTTKSIKEFEQTIAGDPQAALNNWPKLRGKLEQTGAFQPAQLDELGAALQQAGRQAQTELAAEGMRTAVKAWLIKSGWKYTIGASGLGVAGLSGYELYKFLGR